MNTAEKHSSFSTKIAQIETLPPFPLLSNIIKAFVTAESEGEIRPLIDNIETEPNILAKVIGVANSAAFGTPVPVRSIKDAVMKLGIVQLKSLVFSIVITSRFDNKKCPAFQTARFWTDSMLLANCASLLAGHCKNIHYSRNEIHCIGLVLRIGLLALINIAPKEMDKILNAGAGEDLKIRERSEFGNIDHYATGAILLNHWDLPEDYCDAVAHMEDLSYAGKYRDIVLLLRRAKDLLRMDFTSTQSDIDKEIGLSAENIENLASAFINDKNWIESFAKHL